jgi:succinate-acetate transporter protein
MAQQSAVDRGPVVVPEATETRVGLPPIADPAPLGLAAFALTTFLLSAQNAALTDGPDAWLGFALAYGGLIQLLAGMWEFRNRNVFGSTAFSTYGGFWIGLGLWFLLVEPHAGGTSAVLSDLGWILLAFSIFNTYMLLWSTKVNVAVFGVFLTLEATEVILWIGFFSGSTGLIKLGGWVGIITAIVAWYASAAGVINGMGGRSILWVGRPMWREREVVGRAGSPMPRTGTPVGPGATPTSYSG